MLNKQPPNRQLWVASPISGPKRYDWVPVTTNGQNEKADTGADLDPNLVVKGDMRGGHWVYLRDGSTLTDWLKKELDVDVKISTGRQVDGDGNADTVGGNGRGANAGGAMSQDDMVVAVNESAVHPAGRNPE